MDPLQHVYWIDVDYVLHVVFLRDLERLDRFSATAKPSLATSIPNCVNVAAILDGTFDIMPLTFASRSNAAVACTPQAKQAGIGLRFFSFGLDLSSSTGVWRISLAASSVVGAFSDCHSFQVIAHRRRL